MENQTNGHSPDQVWVRPLERQRRGQTVPVRDYLPHHTPRQHEVEHRVAADTDFAATDVAESKLAQFHRNVEAYLQQKKALFNNNSNTPGACTVASRQTDGRSSVILASSSTQRSG